MKNFINELFNNRRKALYTIFILSLFLRLAAIFILADLKKPEMWEFGQIANEMLKGNGYSFSFFGFEEGTIVPSAHMPPGLPVMFYAIFSFFGYSTVTSSIIILLINTILAAFSCILVYKIAEIIYDKRTALVSGLIIAVFPVYIFSTINFNSIIIYHFLLGLSFYYYLKFTNTESSDRNKSKITIPFIIFSVSMGMFLYYRAEMMGFTLLIALLFLFKKQIMKAVLLVLISLVIISPWLIRNYNVFGQFVPGTTSSGLNFYIGHNYAATGSNWYHGTNLLPIYRTPEMGIILKKLKMDPSFEINASKAGFEESFKFMKANPGQDLITTLKKPFYFIFVDLNHPKSFNPLYILPWFFILFCYVAGCIYSRKDPVVKDKLKFVNYYLAFMILIVIIFFSIPRYQIQTSYILIPTASYGLLRIIEKFKPVKK